MLNLDLTQYNPVQSDSQYANLPLPCAVLVTIVESEMKESNKDGFTRGTNLLLEMEILATSVGNEYVGEKLPMYIPYSGFEENAIKAGMKRLSTLSYTLGVGGYLQNKEDLHGQNFILVLEKDAKSNYPRHKRILNAQGQELADASGNFKPCQLRENALQIELEKLLAMLNGGGQQPQTQVQGQPQQAVAPQPQVQQNSFGQQPQQVPQNYTPQFGGQVAQAQPQQPDFGSQQAVMQQPNFGNQQNSFGQQPQQVPQWGQQVNPNNGQQ